MPLNQAPAKLLYLLKCPRILTVSAAGKKLVPWHSVARFAMLPQFYWALLLYRNSCDHSSAHPSTFSDGRGLTAGMGLALSFINLSKLLDQIASVWSALSIKINGLSDILRVPVPVW